MVSIIRLVTFLLLPMILCPGIVCGIPLLEAISEAEGTSDEDAAIHDSYGTFASGYDVPLAYGKWGMPSKPLTEMTISDVQEYQAEIIKSQIAAGVNPKEISGAVGKYQITEGTLADLVDRVFKDDPEITSATIFNAETQEKLAQALLIGRGYVGWLEGTISDSEFQQQLKLEWASIPDPITGTGAYEGQAAGTTTDEMKKAMEETRDVIATSSTLYDTAFFFYSKAIVLANQGNFDGAKQAIDEAIRLRPNFAKAIEKQSEIESHVRALEETTTHAALDAFRIGYPLLSPSDSGMSWGFEGTDDVPETSGDTYFDEANDVWYIDAFEWSGDRSLYPKPAAPRHFVSGELNPCGYNWIYLPFERTGMWHTPGYDDWVTETLASMGMPGPTAGYGVLV